MQIIELFKDMPYTTFLAFAGCVLLLIGILGKFKDWFTLPKILRFFSCLLGAVFIVISILLYTNEGPSDNEKTPTPTMITLTKIMDKNEPIETETQTIQPSFTPTICKTSTRTITPTSTMPPAPLVEIFPQINGGETFVFTNEGGLLTGEVVRAQRCVRSGNYGLEITFDMKNAGNGGWGIHWKNTKNSSFDASEYTSFSFWIKGDIGSETFQICFKDTSGFETRIETKTLTVISTEWTQVSIPLNQFQDVNLAGLENFSFGFNASHGSGRLCIDDILFSP